ncbi:MAG TPA: AbrB/MazE/SpoVT family DNA-binding domain-containing protein [Candidatus Nanoarchaeia archaeon]|nr:AbrB/MazE/SpoVT family DNA-binding domain-containing protein [Candidatus Nanoarchaeia archaeon]
MDFEVAKMGERGQIVIPQSFRKHLRLHNGDKFIVLQEADGLIFKKLSPSPSDFEFMIKKGHSFAKTHNLTKIDLSRALKRARTKK